MYIYIYTREILRDHQYPKITESSRAKYTDYRNPLGRKVRNFHTNCYKTFYKKG